MQTIMLVVLAMNWEGHDDWMKDHPAAVELERQIHQAAPLPPAPCAENRVPLDNRYEQVPLRCVDNRKDNLEPLP